MGAVAGGKTPGKLCMTRRRASARPSCLAARSMECITSRATLSADRASRVIASAVSVLPEAAALAAAALAAAAEPTVHGLPGHNPVPVLAPTSIPCPPDDAPSSPARAPVVDRNAASTGAVGMAAVGG